MKSVRPSCLHPLGGGADAPWISSTPLEERRVDSVLGKISRVICEYNISNTFVAVTLGADEVTSLFQKINRGGSKHVNKKTVQRKTT